MEPGGKRLRIRRVVLDTSVLVAYLRTGRYAEFILEHIKTDSVFLPGVVLAELYARALTSEDLRDVEDFRRALEPHIIGTDERVWLLAGRCLSRYAMRWGKVRRRDHLADILIAVCAARFNLDLITENHVHMQRWSSILNRQGYRLKVLSPPAA